MDLKIETARSPKRRQLIDKASYARILDSLSTALWELLLSPCCVCCFGYCRSRPKTTICHLIRLECCVIAVGFGNGSPGAEYGSLCAVLGGINTKTMQLGGGQVMRGHGREMALLPNAAMCIEGCKV